jgi:hypothetical protein
MSPLKKGSEGLIPRRRAEEDLISSGVKRVRLGVWEAWVATQSRPFAWPGKVQLDQIRQLRITLLYVRRFLTDVYALGPRLVLVIWILGFMKSLLPGLSVYYLSKLLRTVSVPLFISG